MTDHLDFRVRGTPVPQGSVRAYVRDDRAVVNSVTPRLADWRHAIAAEAAEAMGDDPPWTGPIGLRLGFILARPASHFLPANSRRPEPVLRVDAPEYVDRAPDLDKLERAALDALTGVLYLDDRQVARLSADKSWGDIPGVDVRARRL